MEKIRECDIDFEWEVNAGNSDAKCYRQRIAYSRRLRNTDICKDCVYNTVMMNKPKSKEQKDEVRIERSMLWVGSLLVGGGGYNRQKVIFEKGKHIGVSGIDFGNVTIHELYDCIVVAKVKGEVVWAGIGLRSYSPTTYYIIKYGKDNRVIDAWEVVYGKNIKAGKELIKNKVQELLKYK